MPYRDDLVKHIRTDYIPEMQQGKVVGVYTMVIDMTEQTLARAQVMAINEELKATN